MALITTYATLQSALDNWLDHTLHSAKYPEMIQIFEAVANRKLRARQQESTATTVTMTAGTGTLPTDYLAFRRCVASGSQLYELEYVHPSYLAAAYPTSPSDIPRIFTIQGAQLVVRPVPTTETIYLFYYQKIAALSESATSNWLLLAHPDLYLFGSLVEAEMFGVNDERASGWLARRDAIFEEIIGLSNKTRGAGAVRVMGATP